MSGVDPTVRRANPIIMARVKDLIITVRVKDLFTNDRACGRCTHEKSDAGHSGDVLTRTVLQRFKRYVHVD